MRTRNCAFPLLLALAMMLAGCDKDGQATADNGVRQTRFPGQVSAGGGTSGAIMAQAAGGNTGGAAASGANAGQEGVRGQAPGGTGVAGTPGIPEGSGGTTSGAEMGGTTGGAAATQNAPPAVPGQGSAK